MAVVFIQQKKTQKNLMFVFLGVLVIIIVVVWQGFFKKGGEAEILPNQLPTFFKKEIKINFEILKSPFLQELQSFSEIKPFEESTSTKGKVIEKIGRDNPFTPY